MVSNVTVATEIKRLVEQAKDQLLDSMALVERACPSEEYAEYKRAVGRVIAAMLFEIVEPLYETNPSLKPQGWDSVNE